MGVVAYEARSNIFFANSFLKFEKKTSWLLENILNNCVHSIFLCFCFSLKKPSCEISIFIKTTPNNKHRHFVVYTMPLRQSNLLFCSTEVCMKTTKAVDKSFPVRIIPHMLHQSINEQPKYRQTMRRGNLGGKMSFSLAFFNFFVRFFYSFAPKCRASSQAI